MYSSEATSSSGSNQPKPLKTLENLTTSITSLRFNHNSQLLAIASNSKKDQMRMVCHPTSFSYFSVYRNSMAFSRSIFPHSLRSLIGQQVVHHWAMLRVSISPQAANTLQLGIRAVGFCCTNFGTLFSHSMRRDRALYSQNL